MPLLGAFDCKVLLKLKNLIALGYQSSFLKVGPASGEKGVKEIDK